MFKYYFYKVIRSLFPWKNDNKKTIIIKIVSIILALGIIISASVLLSIEYDHVKLKKDNEVIQNVMQELVEKAEPQSGSFDFSTLKEINADIRAWINIENTDIDYPVCQTDDNDYYLNHDFNHKKSPFGTLFFDFANDIEYSQNITIYGHSLKNGQMFTNIKKYKSLDFYKEHPIIQIITESGTKKYKVFAAIVMNAVPEDDNGYFYNYMRTDFNTQREFISWTKEALQRSVILTTVDILPNDRILTLSTCGYEFKNQRFVVMARQLRDGESEIVNVDDAVLNPNPRYPKKWYDTKKQKYPW